VTKEMLPFGTFHTLSNKVKSVIRAWYTAVNIESAWDFSNRDGRTDILTHLRLRLHAWINGICTEQSNFVHTFTLRYTELKKHRVY